MSVDLPAPFSPTSACTSPARSSKRQSLRACTPGKSFEMAVISTRRPPAASATPDPPAEERDHRWRDSPAPVLASSFSLLVQQCGDIGLVDVRLVVPLEAGIDVLVELLALDCLHGGLDALEPDADRVLCDRAGLEAAADRVKLLLTRVVADDGDLARLAGLLHPIEDADDRALVGAEEPLEIRVGL